MITFLVISNRVFMLLVVILALGALILTFGLYSIVVIITVLYTHHISDKETTTSAATNPHTYRA